MIQSFGVVRRASELREAGCEFLSARRGGIETVTQISLVEEPCTILCL